MLPRKPFYFLRHGQTDWNAEKRVQGQLDVPLNSTGIQQAQKAAQVLASHPIERIVSSPLTRARHTAELIQQIHPAKPQLTLEPGLQERHAGSWQGQLWTELLASGVVHPTTPGQHPIAEDSEHFADLEVRIAASLAAILESSTGTPLLVAHGGVFRVIHHLLCGEILTSDNAIPYLFAPTADGWQVTQVDAPQNHPQAQSESGPE